MSEIGSTGLIVVVVVEVEFCCDCPANASFKFSTRIVDFFSESEG